jgi:predicted small secreted protein
MLTAKYAVFSAIVVLVCALTSATSEGAGRKISERGNKHNFSFTNTSVNYRAVQSGDMPTYPRSSQICVFCHTPHNANPEGPLWNRSASAVSFFKHFSSPTLAIDDASVRSTSGYGQPNGSSRLCLSCHDGVTALGAVYTSPLNSSAYAIQFTDARNGLTGASVHIAHQTYSSHHPVSFKYNAAVRAILTSPPYNKTEYWFSPTSNDVKLDSLERMQCTTCHNPHQDQSDTPDPATHPMWTAQTYDEVCATCHNISPLPGNP